MRHRQARDADRYAETLNAPLFRALCDECGQRTHSVVLDLGPAQSGIIALLNRFACRLQIADLAEQLDALNGESDPAQLAAMARASLPAPGPAPADLILCWDLVNYLSREAFGALMDCVAERARPGAQVHMLVVYSASRMPARPSRYCPLPDQGLRRVPQSSEERAAPRYTPEDLSRCMHRYRHERAKLLQGGMQEFVFSVAD